MKRNMELIRKILLEVEEAPTGYAPSPLVIDGHTDEEVGYHCWLIVESGLAMGDDVSSTEVRSPQALLTCLTPEGARLR